MKIMLVDDDLGIRSVIEDIVVQEGYEFHYVSHSLDALDAIKAERPDLLILDVMMPGLNGFDLCRRIRDDGRNIPIIFLSAKGDIVDKSIGFKAGGDDYVVKPFSSEELLLRIDAHIRRHKNDIAFNKESQLKGSSTTGDLEIFHDRYEIRKAGAPLNLSSKEFEIVSFMASEPGKVFTREQILEHIWGDSTLGDLNSVTVFIRRIREKIEDNPSQPKYLLTVWRVGYKFSEG
ncbi:MAG: response regulator transcription factor [Coriobacteriales bacterium]|jgi:DNA-binding response OmpR family regulator|nr:response regulator transcription factor [Coriobacteriales bacterium]